MLMTRCRTSYISNTPITHQHLTLMPVEFQLGRLIWPRQKDRRNTSRQLCEVSLINMSQRFVCRICFSRTELCCSATTTFLGAHHGGITAVGKVDKKIEVIRPNGEVHRQLLDEFFLPGLLLGVTCNPPMSPPSISSRYEPNIKQSFLFEPAVS